MYEYISFVFFVLFILFVTSFAMQSSGSGDASSSSQGDSGTASAVDAAPAVDAAGLLAKQEAHKAAVAQVTADLTNLKEWYGRLQTLSGKKEGIAKLLNNGMGFTPKELGSFSTNYQSIVSSINKVAERCNHQPIPSTDVSYNKKDAVESFKQLKGAIDTAFSTQKSLTNAVKAKQKELEQQAVELGLDQAESLKKEAKDAKRAAKAAEREAAAIAREAEQKQEDDIEQLVSTVSTKRVNVDKMLVALSEDIVTAYDKFPKESARHKDFSMSLFCASMTKYVLTLTSKKSEVFQSVIQRIPHDDRRGEAKLADSLVKQGLTATEDTHLLFFFVNSSDRNIFLSVQHTDSTRGRQRDLQQQALLHYLIIHYSRRSMTVDRYYNAAAWCINYFNAGDTQVTSDVGALSMQREIFNNIEDVLRKDQLLQKGDFTWDLYTKFRNHAPTKDIALYNKTLFGCFTYALIDSGNSDLTKCAATSLVDNRKNGVPELVGIFKQSIRPGVNCLDGLQCTQVESEESAHEVTMQSVRNFYSTFNFCIPVFVIYA